MAEKRMQQCQPSRPPISQAQGTMKDLGVPQTAEQFFGGNFWPQLSSCANESDNVVLAEVSDLLNMDESDILAELQTRGHDVGQLAFAVRSLAQMN